MIFVNRARLPEPAALARVFRSDGKTETDRAIEHYTVAWDSTTPYNFKRYKEDEVKDALEQLFGGKCAYCESKFGHIAPEDIEHWRPKGAVVLADGTLRKPSYYWLAATWTNLLPSCIDCNRRRRQEDARDPTNEQSGKENLFPVADEAHRWTRHDQAGQNGEEPLIIDPCADDPAEFLLVDAEAVMNEKQPAGTRANQRARASIDVFGLNRSKLVQMRHEHRSRVIALLHDIRLGIDQLGLLPAGPVHDATRHSLEDKVKALKAEHDFASEYLLMKAPMIDEFTATVGPRLQALGIGV
jgi:uncharacterized protein (TIGR02646 family)